VPRGGGVAAALAPRAFEVGGAAWSPGGDIVFALAVSSGLSRIRASGGAVSTVTTLDAERGASWHVWPQFLGDGRRFLYGSINPGFEIRVASLDGADDRLVAARGFDQRSTLRYVPGWAFFVEDGVLFAQPFDEDRLELSGEPLRVIDGVSVTAYGRAPFAVSPGGVLAYSAGLIGVPSVLRWFARDGSSADAVAEPGRYHGFSLDADGRRLAFARLDERGGRDVWLRDLDRGAESKLTFDGDSLAPLWGADGRLAFASARNNPPNLFTQTIDAGAAAIRHTTSPVEHHPRSWSTDGALLYEVREPGGERPVPAARR
jgi:eukaryotic-like serine/threonine-protein kinase